MYLIRAHVNFECEYFYSRFFDIVLIDVNLRHDYIHYIANDTHRMCTR